jgi:hypothetical protein
LKFRREQDPQLHCNLIDATHLAAGDTERQLDQWFLVRPARNSIQFEKQQGRPEPNALVTVQERMSDND